MMHNRFLLTLCLLLMTLLPISAQTSPELILEAMIGSPLQGQLLWLDDDHLLIGTSTETRLYQPATSPEPIFIIPQGGQVTIIDGAIVVNGQRFDRETGTLLGETDVVQSWENTSDSLQIDVLADGTAQIRSGESVSELALPEGYPIARVVFSPDAVYAAIVFRGLRYGTTDEILQIWDLSQGTWVADLPNTSGLEHVGEILFFQDGRRMVVNYATSAAYGAVFLETIVWDTSTGQRLNEAYSAFTTLRISPDGQFAMLVNSFGIDVWGMNLLGGLVNPATCEGCDYTGGAFSADGQYFSAVHGRGLTIWEVGQLEVGIIPSEPALIISDNIDYSYNPKTLFHPNGQYVLRWSQEIGIEVWDITTSDLIAQLPVDTWIHDLAFSPDGHQLSVSTSQESLIFDTNNWQEIARIAKRGTINSSLNQSAYWQAGTVVVDNIENQTSQVLPIIDDYRGRVVGINPLEEWVVFQESIYGLTNEFIVSYPTWTRLIVSQGSPYILLGTSEGSLSIIAVQDGDVIEISTVENTGELRGAMLISPDGRTISFLATACGDGGGGTHFVWHGNTGEENPHLFIGGYCGPYDHVFSPDGNLLISSWDKVLAGLDLNQDIIAVENRVYVPNAWYGGRFIQSSSLSISSDSNYLAVNGNYCQIDESGDCRLSDVIDILQIDTTPATPVDFAELLFSIPDARNATFSPDNQFIVTNASVWSITGIEIFTLPNQASTIDPSGKWLVTYADDMLSLWDWGQVQSGSAEPIHQLSITGIEQISFNADGSYLYAQRAGDILRLRIQTN